MCLDQYHTLNNTDLFVKASDGGLKLTYTDVNKLSIPCSLPAYRWQDSTHSKVPTPRSVSCKGLEASVCDIDINKILLGVLLLFRLGSIMNCQY